MLNTEQLEFCSLITLILGAFPLPSELFNGCTNDTDYASQAVTSKCWEKETKKHLPTSGQYPSQIFKVSITQTFAHCLKPWKQSHKLHYTKLLYTFWLTSTYYKYCYLLGSKISTCYQWDNALEWWHYPRSGPDINKRLTGNRAGGSVIVVTFIKSLS